jgi:hypothetical protein
MSEENRSWGTEEAPKADEVTLAMMEDLAAQGFRLRERIKELADEEKEVQESLRNVKGKLLTYLAHFQLPKYQSKLGTIFTKKTYSVRVPKDESSRAQFFEFLKTEGIFDELITVNSRTLNSLYNERLEQAKDAGESFSMPGIEPPTMFEDVQFKK